MHRSAGPLRRQAASLALLILCVGLGRQYAAGDGLFAADGLIRQTQTALEKLPRLASLAPLSALDQALAIDEAGRHPSDELTQSIESRLNIEGDRPGPARVDRPPRLPSRASCRHSF